MKTRTPQFNQSTAEALVAVRDVVEQEFFEVHAAYPHLLRLALNEAEGLAAQTGFPHLVFPLLATEKAGSVAHWVERQHSIRHAESVAMAA